jgi:cell division protein ZapE
MMRPFFDPPPALATLASHPGPMPAYRAKRAAGELKPDPVQELAVEKLQMLHRALLGYRAILQTQPGGWLAALGLGPTPAPHPKGLYFFGGVGRGKSMLMDLFFATSAVPAKRRVHFHAFMQEVHDSLHHLRDEAPGEPPPVLRFCVSMSFRSATSPMR